MFKGSTNNWYSRKSYYYRNNSKFSSPVNRTKVFGKGNNFASNEHKNDGNVETEPNDDNNVPLEKDQIVPKRALEFVLNDVLIYEESKESNTPDPSKEPFSDTDKNVGGIDEETASDDFGVVDLDLSEDKPEELLKRLTEDSNESTMYKTEEENSKSRKRKCGSSGRSSSDTGISKRSRYDDDNNEKDTIKDLNHRFYPSLPKNYTIPKLEKAKRVFSKADSPCYKPIQSFAKDNVAKANKIEIPKFDGEENVDKAKKSRIKQKETKKIKSSESQKKKNCKNENSKTRKHDKEPNKNVCKKKKDSVENGKEKNEKSRENCPKKNNKKTAIKKHENNKKCTDKDDNNRKNSKIDRYKPKLMRLFNSGDVSQDTQKKIGKKSINTSEENDGQIIPPEPIENEKFENVSKKLEELFGTSSDKTGEISMIIDKKQKKLKNIENPPKRSVDLEIRQPVEKEIEECLSRCEQLIIRPLDFQQLEPTATNIDYCEPATTASIKLEASTKISNAQIIDLTIDDCRDVDQNENCVGRIGDDALPNSQSSDRNRVVIIDESEPTPSPTNYNQYLTNTFLTLDGNGFQLLSNRCLSSSSKSNDAIDNRTLSNDETALSESNGGHDNRFLSESSRSRGKLDDRFLSNGAQSSSVVASSSRGVKYVRGKVTSSTNSSRHKSFNQTSIEPSPIGVGSSTVGPMLPPWNGVQLVSSPSKGAAQNKSAPMISPILNGGCLNQSSVPPTRRFPCKKSGADTLVPDEVRLPFGESLYVNDTQYSSFTGDLRTVDVTNRRLVGVAPMDSARSDSTGSLDEGNDRTASNTLERPRHPNATINQISSNRRVSQPRPLSIITLEDWQEHIGHYIRFIEQSMHYDNQYLTWLKSKNFPSDIYTKEFKMVAKIQEFRFSNYAKNLMVKLHFSNINSHLTVVHVDEIYNFLLRQGLRISIVRMYTLLWKLMGFYPSFYNNHVALKNLYTFVQKCIEAIVAKSAQCQDYKKEEFTSQQRSTLREQIIMFNSLVLNSQKIVHYRKLNRCADRRNQFPYQQPSPSQTSNKTDSPSNAKTCDTRRPSLVGDFEASEDGSNKVDDHPGQSKVTSVPSTSKYSRPSCQTGNRNRKKPTDASISNEIAQISVPVDDVIDLTWLKNVLSSELEEAIDFMIIKKEEVEIQEDSVLVDDNHFTSLQINKFVLSGRYCICNKPAILICSCRMAMYCSNNCQIIHWPEHKKMCVYKKG
ncbi:homeobox protein 2-like [Diorhabda sublineata]|uniref:homeobox protein 2-like n=1 Tax=Diorhabda sublineata TaxID=1163346 RepID=UPI0024E0A3D5|nr:homeobox protein 2-like [Diorhabda sublineata]